MVTPASSEKTSAHDPCEKARNILRNQALDETRRELIKDIVKTALFALAGAVLIGLAVASAPVGGALAFGIIAGVCGVITVGGVISIRKRWQELNDLAQ